MSYLASPLWLMFLSLSGIEATRYILWPINYFPAGPSLYPLWPQWNPNWAIQLAGSTAIVLFLPKVIAVVDLLLAGQARAYGGSNQQQQNTQNKLLASIMLAPIRM